MAIEISSNGFWGKRYGGLFTPKDQAKSDGSWGWHFPKVGLGSKANNSGKTVNTPATAESKAAKKKFLETGRPTIVVDWRNKRIH